MMSSTILEMSARSSAASIRVNARKGRGFAGIHTAPSKVASTEKPDSRSSRDSNWRHRKRARVYRVREGQRPCHATFDSD